MPRARACRSGGVANRLASATSPYLLQYAENPVDWWEWGWRRSTRRGSGRFRPCCRSATPHATGVS
ncbi:DUF255 domain-containing protein [Nocardioides sp. NPDC101246]|uniref:DUF255 domain-containing protein n=1 Tax=Nocardioides sp. NPDC101246 TaxID=3364336 RepID=UPI0038128689